MFEIQTPVDKNLSRNINYYEFLTFYKKIKKEIISLFINIKNYL